MKILILAQFKNHFYHDKLAILKQLFNFKFFNYQFFLFRSRNENSMKYGHVNHELACLVRVLKLFTWSAVLLHMYSKTCLI